MSRHHKILVLVLFAGVLAMPAGDTLAQSQKPKPAPQQPQEPEPEYTEEEYDAYDKAVNQEKDPDKQGPALISFMEKYPKSKLQGHIVPAYQTLLYNYRKSENWAKLGQAAEQWLKYFPNDLPTIDYAAAAAAKLGQDKKFIEYGQKVYAAKPTPDYAYLIAQNYKKLGDRAKYEEWIEKALADPKYADRFDLRDEFVDRYTKEKNFAKAAEYAQLTLKSLDAAKKPATTSQADWDTAVTAVRKKSYYLIGVNQYDQEKYAEAIKSLERCLVIDKKFDWAYYYIGLSEWKLGKLEDDDRRGAILSFAKAYLLKGEASPQAKEHMEKLYKALHNDTLIGLDKVTTLARKELGMERASNDSEQPDAAEPIASSKQKKKAGRRH